MSPVKCNISSCISGKKYVILMETFPKHLVPAVFLNYTFHLFYKTAYGKLLIWRRKHGFLVKNKETLIPFLALL